jgi:hypothetical protein
MILLFNYSLDLIIKSSIKKFESPILDINSEVLCMNI